MAFFDAPFVYIAVGLFFSTLLGQFFKSAANAYITDLTSPNDRATAFRHGSGGIECRLDAWASYRLIPGSYAFLLLFSLTAMLCLVAAEVFPITFVLRLHQQNQK